MPAIATIKHFNDPETNRITSSIRVNGNLVAIRTPHGSYFCKDCSCCNEVIENEAAVNLLQEIIQEGIGLEHEPFEVLADFYLSDN